MPGDQSDGKLLVTIVTNYAYVSTRYYCLKWFLCGATWGRGKPLHRNQTKERMGLLLNLL
jgi:hypothetical protein